MATEAVAHNGFLSADDQRKRLGQYFTGLPAARLLAALAQTQHSISVIDPMVGSGDMLMGTLAHAEPEVIGGIEIEPNAFSACAARLEEAGHTTDALVLGSAFAPQSLRKLPTRAWDVVITNPPYVRYQSTSVAAGAGLPIPSGPEIRRDLIASIDELDALDDQDKHLFRELARGYSGLSDLAVPSWILCAGLVRVGGTLAVLVPATWLSRDYAHPIRYLIDRWFDVVCVVEDGDASWFSDALVRTTLIVAERVPRRTSAFDAAPADGHVNIRLSAGMTAGDSLVGALFDDRDDPDVALANVVREWKAAAEVPRDHALQPRWIQSAPERRSVRRAVAGEGWFKRLDETHDEGSLAPGLLPHGALAGESRAASDDFVTLEELGWSAGQGLRTGANRFFYLEAVETGEGCDRLLPHPCLGETAVDVPHDLVRRVLRRQADLPTGFKIRCSDLHGRVLVLDEWALPEDLEALPPHPYRPLQPEVATLVRAAARVNLGTTELPRHIPTLSAVAPNARSFSPEQPQRPARFWYQLPPLTDRHLPCLFVARVNSGHPRTFLNLHREAVIDANFSTLWPTPHASVSPHALLAVLNSAWCVAEMELRGTVLGGGALKLEATHLRRLPLPRLTRSEWQRIDDLGSQLVHAPSADEATEVLNNIDRLVLTAVRTPEPDRAVREVRELAAEWLRRRSS